MHRIPAPHSLGFPQRSFARCASYKYEQREYGQTFKGNGVAGKKRRKLEGESVELDDGDRVQSTCKPRTNTQPPSANLPKGPWLDRGRYVTSVRPQQLQKPISAKAMEILAEYHRRRAFWDAFNERDATVEFAGKAFLGLARRRTYKVKEEMPDGDTSGSCSNSPSTLPRRNEPGGATEQSRDADHFFTELAGGRRAFDRLRHRLGGRRKADDEELSADLGPG